MGPRPSSRSRAVTLSRAQRTVLDLVRSQDGPTPLARLAELSGLHENTLRGHLDYLEDNGLVTREKAQPQGRGRPAWLWQVTTNKIENYAGLATALARTLRRTSTKPADDAVEAGRAWGLEIAANTVASGSSVAPAESPVARVRDLLHGLGFAPTGTIDRRTASADLLLTRCPLLEVAREEPAITCNVHRGLVAGVLEHYGERDPEVRLTPFSEPGGCRLQLGRSVVLPHRPGTGLDRDTERPG